jgi:hypothetical protein
MDLVIPNRESRSTPPLARFRPSASLKLAEGTIGAIFQVQAPKLAKSEIKLNPLPLHWLVLRTHRTVPSTESRHGTPVSLSLFSWKLSHNVKSAVVFALSVSSLTTEFHFSSTLSMLKRRYYLILTFLIRIMPQP